MHITHFCLKALLILITLFVWGIVCVLNIHDCDYLQSHLVLHMVANARGESHSQIHGVQRPLSAHLDKRLPPYLVSSQPREFVEEEYSVLLPRSSQNDIFGY